MTLYLVVWLSTAYDCPWGLGKAPTALKELVCTRRQSKEYLVTSSLEQVRRQVRGAGDGDPLVLELRGARARRADVVWEPIIR